MDNKDTKENQDKTPTIVLSDFTNEEMKITLVLFKVIVDSHSNDNDLGKYMRDLFNKIKFDK